MDCVRKKGYAIDNWSMNTGSSVWEWPQDRRGKSSRRNRIWAFLRFPDDRIEELAGLLAQNIKLIQEGCRESCKGTVLFLTHRLCQNRTVFIFHK